MEKTDSKTGLEYIADYLMRIQAKRNELKLQNDDIIVYRGHADIKYQFIPSLFREGNERVCQNEARFLEQLEVERPDQFSNMTTLEKLVKIQHYGFVTRILDVTSNPLVALYFAARATKKDKNQERHDGNVFMCRIPRKFIKTFDDDTAMCLANLARLSESEKQQLKEAFLRKQTKTEDKCIVEHFINIILSDRPYFNSSMFLKNLEDLYNPIYVNVKKANPRILAQQGAFIIFGMNDNEKSMTWIQNNITSVKIDKQYKKATLEALSTLNINKGTLFPEFDSFLADALKRAKNGIFV